MIEDITPKIDAFFSQYRTRKYAKGQVLLLIGENTNYVYHLLKGNVKQYDVTYRGDEIILNIFKPPAFFPMSLAINGGKNQYIYQAETDIEIRQAPADEATAFIRQNPDVMFDLLSRVYRGLDGLLGRMGYLMAGSAKSRVIYELIIEARRFGKAEDNGHITISINEKDLGSRAGLSRETVSREIARLKSDNLVTVAGKRIYIKDMRALEKQLGQEV